MICFEDKREVFSAFFQRFRATNNPGEHQQNSYRDRHYKRQADGMERRLSEEYRRQSVLMTSGRAYTISGILSHQVLLSGIIALVR